MFEPILFLSMYYNKRFYQIVNQNYYHYLLISLNSHTNVLLKLEQEFFCSFLLVVFFSDFEFIINH